MQLSSGWPHTVGASSGRQLGRPLRLDTGAPRVFLTPYLSRPSPYAGLGARRVGCALLTCGDARLGLVRDRFGVLLPHVREKH